MKKVLLILLVCIAVVGVVVLGIVVLPKSDSHKKAVASKQAQSQALERLKNLLASSQRSATVKPAAKVKPSLSNEQPTLTDKQAAQIGQALHDRREKALQAKDSKALVALGDEVLKAASFPGYKKLAAMCFMDAAKLGSPEGMMRAGWCYQDGVGVDSGAKQAFNFYFEAGEAGLPDGYAAAARMVLAGEKNLGDVDTAMALINKAMDMGSDEAKFLKGTVLLAQGENTQSGLDYIMDAAKADYPDAQRLLGQLYEEGKYLPKDTQAAAEWAKYAADLGLPSANTDYASLMSSDNSGVTGNDKEAFERLMQSANQGDADAAFQIASSYHNVANPSAEDMQQTRTYATMAFENGRGDAAFLAATTYSPNENDSISEWLKKGVQNSDWQSRYASSLIENENITPYAAVQQAAKATLAEATNYGISNIKDAPPEFTGPKVVSMVTPDMPAALRTIDLDTVVKVQFLVNEDGIPVNVQVTSPSPYEELNKAAVDAVAQWRYKPATQNGVIVPVQISAPLKFQSRR